MYNISKCQKQIENIDFSKFKAIELNLDKLVYLDTGASVYINSLNNMLTSESLNVNFSTKDSEILRVLNLAKNNQPVIHKVLKTKKVSFLEKLGRLMSFYYEGFLLFLFFIGKLTATKFSYLRHIKNIRYKEIAFEINESAIKALVIICLTNFLVGLVIAYQSAYQLQMYGANIFIVDMLGISILRELAPLITAIVIAGRSGSAFTAQIGAMKITEELDAMRTMGFDPYLFLVLPRIIALMLMMPILITIADFMAVLGGMIISNLDLNISFQLFIERFREVVAVKHYFVGLIKGPFFAFLIATIGIHRGLIVKDDTQSIGFNTTKSVVESIFAVIICDAIFSIAFTNLGI